MLSLPHGGQPEWLENSIALDTLIGSGLAWVEADFEEGRWMVRRVVATPVPSVSSKSFTARSKPRERQFKIVASA